MDKYALLATEALHYVDCRSLNRLVKSKFNTKYLRSI